MRILSGSIPSNNVNLNQRPDEVGSAWMHFMLIHTARMCLHSHKFYLNSFELWFRYHE